MYSILYSLSYIAHLIPKTKPPKQFQELFFYFHTLTKAKLVFTFLM